MWDFILEVLKEMGDIFLALFAEMSFWGPILIIVFLYFIGFGINYGANYFDDLKMKTFFVGGAIILGSIGLIVLNVYASKTEGFVDDANKMNYYLYASLVFIILQIALPEINIPIQEFFRGIRETIDVSIASDGGVVVEKSAEAIIEVTGWGVRILVTLLIVFVSMCLSHLIFAYVPIFIKNNYLFYTLSTIIGILVFMLAFKISDGVSSGEITIKRE